MLQKGKRLWALFLSAALVMTQLPAAAMAENNAPEDQGIVSLGHGEAVRKHENDTGEDKADGGIDGLSGADSGDTATAITGWTFADDENLTGDELALPGVSMDNQADFDTVVSMLPTQISATIEGTENLKTLDITGWNCDEYKQDSEDNWPLTGEYIFTAALEENYACDPLPTVKVLLGGGNLYANGEYDGLTITGGTVTQDPDGQIKLTENGNYTISGTWTGTLTNIIYSNQKAVITVPDGVTANVTLNGAAIDASGTDYACAFAVEAGGTANITLSGTNTLESGWYRAGLSVPKNATVNINGAGVLNATGGGNGGAGIGSDWNRNGGTIKITDGKVIANGGEGGAGIGGGYDGAGGTITIEGGKVNATGGSSNGGAGGAGIGGGAQGSGGTIKITGGEVEATGGNGLTDGNGLTGGDGAGIGGGGGNVIHDIAGTITHGGDGGNVEISGANTKVTATGGDNSNDVGSGEGSYNGGSLSVTDGAQLTLKKNGTNVTTPEYKSCTIIDKDGNVITYDENSNTSGDIAAFRKFLVDNPKLQNVSGVVLNDPSTWSPLVEWDYSSPQEIAGLTLNGKLSGEENTLDLTSLSGLNKLTTLSCSDNNLTELKGLDNLTNLTTLSCYNNNLKKLDKLPNLTHLNCSHNNLTDLKGLEMLTKLTYLYCSGNKLTELNGLEMLPDLRELFCNNNKLTELNGLDKLLELTYLNCFINNLAELKGLDKLTNLTYLSCSNNNLTELKGLDKLTNLTYLFCSNNNLTELKGLDKLTNLTYLDCSNNPYTSFTTKDGNTLTVTPANGGTVWMTDYDKDNNKVKLTPKPDPRYTFEKWEKLPPGATESGNTATFTLDGDKTVQAPFAKAAISVTDVKLNRSTLTLTTGQTATLSATVEPANASNKVVSWISSDTSIARVDGNGNVTAVKAGTAIITVTTTDGSKTDTCTVTVKTDSGGSGNSSGGGSSYIEPQPQNRYTVTGDNISRSVSRSDLKQLADTGKSLTLSCDKAGMTFDPAALKAILTAVPATAGNITFAAAPADPRAFPDAAKQLGAHPVYDFAVSYKNSKGNTVRADVNFPAGSAAVTLNYAPAAAEVTGNLFMVHVDGKGAVTWLNKSSYDGGKMLAEVPHFSIYGVACKAPAPVFTDISGHWAKEDMEFAAARGLLSGTGNNLFSPDGTMTRGMFVTALGRLAGVNPDSYQTRSFTDVKADAYYAAYVEWAVQKNIVKGTGDKLFSPDAPVTREQMAAVMANYAGQMGYTIPATLSAATFADDDQISAWAAKEVAAMQQAGIIRGKDGNRFDPQGNATRAEMSAVLRRFVETIIDPSTATGWVKNDSGHWLYYQDGKALTGWQTIGKLRYFFKADGVMLEGWKQDESTGKWYYWTNAGAATGWRKIGKWYYFDENGVMAVNTRVDGYEVGPDGAWKED